MAKYKVRKLYQANSNAGPNHTAIESVWAYTVEYSNSNNPVPGRFRIRVTKLPARDYIIMMGGDPTGYEEGESIQGFLEKWSDKGWLQCLDWLGDVNSSVENVEDDLLQMFEAFTTGVPSSKNWDTEFDSKPTPFKPPKKKTKPTLKVIEGDKPPPTPDDSLDWL